MSSLVNADRWKELGIDLSPEAMATGNPLKMVQMQGGRALRDEAG
jgi:hypothetical protein